MKLTGNWLTGAATQDALALLTTAGWHALCVGGCVRNALLGVPVTDVDIATDAQPQTVLQLAEAAGIKAVPTGIEHGTVTLVIAKRGFEVTTFRRDIATDGRHAQVAFSDNLAEDAARRDFTINALYAKPDGTVVDPLGGMVDLHARRLRFIGDPHARIAEDYLRILRFFRFHAQYGDPLGGLDADALEACAELGDGLARISAERVGAEMRKLLCAPDPAPSVAAMAQTGILLRVLPGADASGLAPLVHLEGSRRARWLRRLLVLGGDCSGLRLTRVETRQLSAMRAALGSMQPPGELGYRLDQTRASDVMLARAALSLPVADDWEESVTRGAAARFPVKSADLPQLSGPELGKALRKMEAAWIASDFTLTREDLLHMRP